MIPIPKGSDTTVSNRNTPLSTFFSIFGVLSKKKNKNGKKILSRKNGEVGISEDISILGMDGELSLPSDISIPEDLMDMDETLGDSILEMGNTMSSTSSEIETNVTDLRNQVDKLEISSNSVKNEISTIREDITQINDSIKSLLCIYEAVSKEYNPFVDSSNESRKKTINIVDGDEPPSRSIHPSEKQIDELEDERAKNEPQFDNQGLGPNAGGLLELDTLHLNDNVEEKIILPMDSAFEPFDPNEPLDRVLKVDEDDETDSKNDLEDYVESDPVDMPSFPDPIQVKELKVAPGSRTVDLREKEPRAISESNVDSYCLNQIVKIVEHKIDRIHASRLRGNKVGLEEIQSLERWLLELLN